MHLTLLAEVNFYPIFSGVSPTGGSGEEGFSHVISAVDTSASFCYFHPNVEQKRSF